MSNEFAFYKIFMIHSSLVVVVVGILNNSTDTEMASLSLKRKLSQKSVIKIHPPFICNHKLHKKNRQRENKEIHSPHMILFLLPSTAN
jgi:hypothetical protein